ncbi:MAG: CoA ester lyase [Alphaproteobacteria bacterium]|jgi:citrate lyase beta subunit|nr:CoA ester lyase [Alphaproteobacteria bacterium]MDP6588743.1 CoA ester lyase [Alphaproteobacteria bacterium]
MAMEPDSGSALRRSLLFTPGLRTDRFAKALKGGADMVCLDLEDGVAPDFKDEARDKAIPALFDATLGAAARAMRINPIKTHTGMRDLLALCDFGSAPPALLLPKIESPEEVRWVAEILDEAGYDRTRLMVIIETTRALEAALDIASASPRNDTLLFGAADLSAELGSSLDWGALHYARGRAVHAASHAGLDLIDVPSLDIKDEEGLRSEARLAQRMGFTGKAAIHPVQVAPINEVFSPDAETVEFARRVIEAYEQSAAGVALLDGKVVEMPVVRAMRRALAIAEKIAAGAP